MGVVTPTDNTEPSAAPAYDPAAEVVDLCSELIRIDTTNAGDNEGPGERKAIEYVARLLDEVGIDSVITESAPGRANLVARWGEGEAAPLLVHGHVDVVPAEASDWQVHPFSGEIRDDCVWGRGAVDMKDFDAMVLSVVRARARAGQLPSRPVVLAFTADEEAGSIYGAEHLVDNHADLLADCTDAIGEVGGFTVPVRGRRLYLIQAAEKGMAWMRLKARGTAGHGSMINPDNAVTRLAETVARIGSYEWPTTLTPSMEALLATVGEIAGIEPTPENAEALIAEFGPAARMIGAVLRHTTNPSGLTAGYKVNVIPERAEALIDGRFLPGHEDDIFSTLGRLTGESVEVEYITRQPAVMAPYSGSVVDAMHRSILAEDDDAVIAPYLLSGGTDGKQWTRLGIRCYGFTPLRLPEDLDFTALFHGVDERVPVDSLQFGSRVLDRFLDEI